MILIACKSCQKTHFAADGLEGHWAMCPVTNAWLLIPFTSWDTSPRAFKERTAVRTFGLFRHRSSFTTDWRTRPTRELTSEEEWDDCIHLVNLLHCALKEASPRKLRLFAAACARQVIPFTNRQASWAAVDAAEAWAYGFVNDQALLKAELAAWDAWMHGGTEADRAARAAALADPQEAVFTASLATRGLIAAYVQNQYQRWKESIYPRWLEKGKQSSPEDQREMLAWKEKWESELGRDALIATETQLKDLLLDVFGNPFKPVRLPSTWLGRHESTVVKMAQVVYQNQSFEDMPVLGDALEDADCPVDSILKHCREHPLHSRGCHVLHAILYEEEHGN